MNPIDPNSPAFPQWDGHAITSEPLYLRGGISIRALIAKDLMAGLLANPDWSDNPIEPESNALSATKRVSLVEMATRAADSLIAQLNK